MMIFSVSKGSVGDGNKLFVLYVPFSLAAGRTITIPEKSEIYNFIGYEIHLEKLTYFYAITVGYFDTMEDARDFFPKLCASLLWVSIKNGMGISYPKYLSEVRLFEHSQSMMEENDLYSVFKDWNGLVEGEYDSDKAIVIPDGRKLSRWEMGRASLSIARKADCFMGEIYEAFAFPSLEKVVGDNKLRLAIELYSASFFESSENAQFIAFVNVLEALIPEVVVSDVERVGLDRAKCLIKKMREDEVKGSREWRQLGCLLSRMGDLKKQSIGASLREYILVLVDEFPSLECYQGIDGKLKHVYDCRSRLLHTGAVSLDEVKLHLSFLRRFIPGLLKELYRKKSG